MAVGSKNLFTHTFRSSVDLSAATNQFTLVKLVGGEVAAIAAHTDLPIGVLQNNPKLGDMAVVAISGMTKLRVGAADIAAGDLVGSAVGGGALALTSGTSVGFYVCGRVLEIDNADNDGALVSALIDASNPPKNA
jgi:hypothetical protein